MTCEQCFSERSLGGVAAAKWMYPTQTEPLIYKGSGALESTTVCGVFRLPVEVSVQSDNGLCKGERERERDQGQKVESEMLNMEIALEDVIFFPHTFMMPPCRTHLLYCRIIDALWRRLSPSTILWQSNPGHGPHTAIKWDLYVGNWKAHSLRLCRVLLMPNLYHPMLDCYRFHCSLARRIERALQGSGPQHTDAMPTVSQQ